MITAYLITSFLLSLLFLRGLAAYDGPAPDDRRLDEFFLNPNVGYDQKMNLDIQFKMRRWLSGSWFRAAWLFSMWIGIPMVFFRNGQMPFFAAFLFALPGGFALAVAWYNARKHFDSFFHRKQFLVEIFAFFLSILPGNFASVMTWFNAWKHFDSFFRRIQFLVQKSPLTRYSLSSWYISPQRESSSDVKIRNSCPGLSHTGFMVGFWAVTGSVYYGGCRFLGMSPIDWAAPVWTSTHVCLIIAGLILGFIIGLVCSGLAMKIDVESELINDFITTLWQFCCNGAMVWIMGIGVGISVALGKDEAKAHLMHLGMEKSTLLVLGIGCLVGLVMGIIFFCSKITRIRTPGYIVLAAGAGSFAASWQYQLLGVVGRSWVVVGLLTPVILLFISTKMFRMSDFRFLTISPDPKDFVDLQSQMSGHAVSPGVSITIEHLNMKDPSLARKCRVEEWSGIIPILTPDTICSGVLSEIVHRALSHQIENEVFFVVPWLKGLNLQQLRQLAQNGNGMAADILENIHITDELTTCSGVADALQQCCKNARGLVLSSQYERVKHKITYMIGRIAAAILFSGGAFVYIVVFFKSPQVVGPEAVERLIPLLPSDVMRCMALTLLTAFMIYFFQLIRLKNRGTEFVRLHPQMKFEFLPVVFLGFGCAFLIQQYGFSIPGKVAVIGVGAGIALMSVFRAGCRAKLTPFSFSDIPEALSEKTLLAKLYARMATSIAHTGSPFIRPMVNRAFISYSPASKWCSDTAVRIYNILRDKGSKVFLDRKGLLPGQSWKSQLERSLKHTNVFIIILDEVSSLREWVISEFSYAYLCKMLIRSPEIFIIHPRGMDFSQLNTAHPHAWFFSEIVVRPSVNIPYWMRMKMAELDDESVDAMCTKIRHWGGGIVNIWGLIIFVLRAIAVVPIEIILSFSSIFGPFFLALPFLVTELGGKKISAHAVCATHPDIAFIAGLLSTSLVGCCASLSLARLFGFKSTTKDGIGIRMRGMWNFFGIIGFGLVAWFWSRCFGWQDHALQFLTAYFGFAIGWIIIEESDFFDDTPPPKLSR